MSFITDLLFQVQHAHPVLQGFLGTLFTWFMTTLGAAVVFVSDVPERLYRYHRLLWTSSQSHGQGGGGTIPKTATRPKADATLNLDMFYGFGGGVMLAASFFSLLAPAVEISEEMYEPWFSWVPPVSGFIVGVGSLWILDVVLDIIMRKTVSRQSRLARAASSLTQQQQQQQQQQDQQSALDTGRSTEEMTEIPVSTTVDQQLGSLSLRKCDTEHHPADAQCSNQESLVVIGNGDRISQPLPESAASTPSSSETESPSSTTQQPADTAIAISSASATIVADQATESSSDSDHAALTSQSRLAALERRRKTLLLMLAITVHNLPEGLVVGVAFGAAVHPSEAEIAFRRAAALALGIGLQNIPEGVAISMPLRRDGQSKLKAFFWGQLSGVVEIIGGLLGSALVVIINALLPFALSFASGAMVFVVICQLVPEISVSKRKSLSMVAFMIGFVLMMTLDIALG